MNALLNSEREGAHRSADRPWFSEQVRAAAKWL
jgi:hypothetical protein